MSLAEKSATLLNVVAYLFSVRPFPFFRQKGYITIIWARSTSSNKFDASISLLPTPPFHSSPTITIASAFIPFPISFKIVALFQFQNRSFPLRKRFFTFLWTSLPTHQLSIPSLSRSSPLWAALGFHWTFKYGPPLHHVHPKFTLPLFRTIRVQLCSERLFHLRCVFAITSIRIYSLEKLKLRILGSPLDDIGTTKPVLNYASFETLWMFCRNWLRMISYLTKLRTMQL